MVEEGQSHLFDCPKFRPVPSINADPEDLSLILWPRENAKFSSVITQQLLGTRMMTMELARSSLFFQRLLEGHVYDVNCCRFFPSGLVVLSGGMDAQLKIWSAEDASCVVTFKGHKAGTESFGYCCSWITGMLLLGLSRGGRGNV